MTTTIVESRLVTCSFFVISGYMMSALLTSEDAFSPQAVARFYFRRIKRIMPPCIGIIATTLLVGVIVVLAPVEWAATARDARASALFVSNYEAANELRGYFDLVSC